MKAIILAGGIGTRLRPLSCTRPKLLFPVLNKPLLDGTLERLSDVGVDELVLAVKYMAEVFMLRYGDSKHGVEISYSIEKRPMGTGGAIKYAEHLIGHGEPFLVLNGDIFTTIDYSEIIKKHNESNAIATIALYRVEDPSRYGTVKLTEGNKITQFVEKAPLGKAPSNLINAGVYVLNPEVFDYIPAGRPVSIEREVFPKLAQEGKLFGYEFNEIWIDIGKLNDYLQANRLLLDNKKQKRRLGKNVKLDAGVQFSDPVLIDDEVHIGQNSKVGPYTIIGKDVVLGKKVTLKNSIVFPDANLMDNCSVVDSVIGEGAIIGSNTKIGHGCVIGDYAKIHDNVNISGNVTVCHSKEVSEDIPENKRVI